MRPIHNGDNGRCHRSLSDDCEIVVQADSSLPGMSVSAEFEECCFTAAGMKFAEVQRIIVKLSRSEDAKAKDEEVLSLLREQERDGS